MRIGFIFVTYKTPAREIKRLRREIKTLKGQDIKIYEIDNSYDNKGYASGINNGLRRAIKERCDLFILANPDISLTGLSMTDLLKGSLHFDVWGFAMQQGSKRYYGGYLDQKRLSAMLCTKNPIKRFMPTTYVTGSLMCIKKKVVNTIGDWDESYFMYYEDVDYCIRAKKAGFKIGIDSHIIYNHHEWSKKNKLKEKYLSSSRWKFFRKHSNYRQKIYELLRFPKTTFEYLKTVKMNTK